MQQALTVITRIKPDEADALEALLDTIGQDINGRGGNTYIDFSRFTRIHFMRWVMIPNVETGKKDYLLFCTNYDGPLSDHLDELIEVGGEALDLIWGRCERYPGGRTENPERFKRAFKRYINRHSYDYSAFYIGYRGETVGDVRRYAELRDSIQRVLNQPAMRQFANHTLKDMVDRMPVRVPGRWAQARGSVWQSLKRMATFAVFLLELVFSLLNVFIFRPLKNLILRREPALGLKLSDQRIEPGITEIEDVVTQNQLTVISPIKRGLWVGIRLRVVLVLINLVGKHYQNQGSLGGIITIHFARWVIIDRGRYLLFNSNYDGSWANYIGEFVDKAAAGMDAIWTSAPGYPEQGSIDIEAFKSIIRRNQVRTQIFYSAYPQRTVMNILNDREIARPLEREVVRRWLRRL